MKCVKCKKNIAKARLKALPDTDTCVKCSEVAPMVGLTIWDKTSADLLVVDKSKAERLWELERADGFMTRF